MEKKTQEQHLADLRAGLARVLRETRRLADLLSEEQRLWKPAPDRWSVAQCFEHLILTGAAYYPLIEEAIDRAPPATPGKVRYYRPTSFGRLFLASGGPRVRIRLRAHALFDPPEDVPADAPERFCSQQAELEGLIDRAAGVDLRIAVRAPHSRFLGLRLGETLELMVQHQQRHLLQAYRVAEEAGVSMAEGAPNLL